MKLLRTMMFTAAASVAVLFSGCGGATGPAGAQGPQGPSGVTGTSVAFIETPSDWQATFVSPYYFLIAGYNVSAITQDVINTAVVMVYYQASTGVWTALPYTYPLSSSVEQTFTFNYSLGALTLQMQNSDNSTPLAPSNNVSFNLVIIPTSIVRQHPGFNWNDYASVKQLLATTAAATK